MSEIKVLILDDELELSKVICDFLTQNGFNAEFINKPKEIFKKLENFKPNVLILDKSMPKKNGIDVLKEIRSVEEYEKLPIIMLTANRNKEDEIESFQYGIDDFIGKPFDLDVLVARIEALHKRSKK